MLMKSILLIGASGMLGSDIHLLAKTHNITVVAPSSSELDITNQKLVNTFIEKHAQVDVVINCAAYTKVDDCEKNQDMALSVNQKGPFYLAKTCHHFDLPLVHFSTDYVFDGTKDTPYTETDAPNPLSVYGQSKLSGEQAIQANCPDHYIFRVQWLYGANGHHFINTMKTLFKTKPELSVVCDQLGTPTATTFIAQHVLHLLNKGIPYGTYHLAPAGFTHWADYAAFLAQQLNAKTIIKPIDTAHFIRPATRPLNGRLNTSKVGALLDAPLANWADYVSYFMSTNL